MKVGDLVKLKSRTRFTGGETLERGEIGVLIERTYLAYHPESIKWMVMFKDNVRSVTQGKLTKVEASNESW